MNIYWWSTDDGHCPHCYGPEKGKWQGYLTEAGYENVKGWLKRWLRDRRKEGKLWDPEVFFSFMSSNFDGVPLVGPEAVTAEGVKSYSLENMYHEVAQESDNV